MSRCLLLYAEAAMPKGDEDALLIDPHGPPPTIEIDLGQAIALLKLDRKLKAELATFATGSSETELIRGVRQLGAMIQAVQSDPEVIALNVHQPALKLYQALVDLCAGGTPSLLFEAPRPPDVKTKQKFSPAHYPQGLLAIGYAALVTRGNYKPGRAVKWFTTALKARKISADGNDVQGWHYQATTPNGKPPAGLMQAFRDYQPRLASLRSPAEAEDFANKCVAAVHGMGVERLKLRKPKIAG
jgi:hypothetical protein